MALRGVALETTICRALYCLSRDHFFPILCRRLPYLFLKHPAEIQWVLIPYDFGNFLDVVGRPLQQALGVDHAQGEDVLGRGHTCVLFEIVYKPVGADVQGFRIIVYADLCVIVLIEVSRRAFNLLLDIAGGFFLFMLLTIHQQQNIIEQRCDIILVPIAAQLQLLE